uniref:Uncharacterized protein n=1 Tax=Arundo donax TaxID=35708 RepID=A0A0A8ZD39_ARUDO
MTDGWAWTIKKIDDIVVDLGKIAKESFDPCSCKCSMDANRLVLQLEEVVRSLQKLAIQSAELLDRQDVGHLEGEDAHTSVDPNDVVPYDYTSSESVTPCDDSDEYWWLPSESD